MQYRQPQPEVNEDLLKSKYNEAQFALITDTLKSIQGYQENKQRTISLLLEFNLSSEQLINFLYDDARSISELNQFLEEHQSKQIINIPPLSQNKHNHLEGPDSSDIQMNFQNSFIASLLALVQGMDEEQMKIINAQIFKNKIPEQELFEFLRDNQECQLSVLRQFIAKYNKESQLKVKEISQEIQKIDDAPLVPQKNLKQLKFKNDFIEIFLSQIQDLDDSQMQTLKAKIFEYAVPETDLLNFLNANQQCSLQTVNDFVDTYVNQQKIATVQQVNKFDFVNELTKLGKPYLDKDLNITIYTLLSPLLGFEQQQKYILDLLLQRKIPYDVLIQFLYEDSISIESFVQFIKNFKTNQVQEFNLNRELISLGWDEEYVEIISNSLTLITKDPLQLQQIISSIKQFKVQYSDLIQFLFNSDNINLERLFAFIKETQQITTDSPNQTSQITYTHNVFDQLHKLKWHENTIQMFKDVLLSKELNQEQIQTIIQQLIKNELSIEIIIEYFTFQYTNYENCLKFISSRKQMITQLSQLKSNSSIIMPTEFNQDQKIAKLFSEELSKIYPIQFINKFAQILHQQNFKTFDKINSIVIPILDYYEFLDPNLILEICQGSGDKIVNSIRKAALDRCFINQQGSKTIYELVDELLHLNQDIDLSEIITLVEGVQQMKIQQGIKQNEIHRWAKAQKINTDNKITANDLMMVCQGVYLFAKYYPRDTQLISVLLLFQAKKQGRLAQIYTGEGKSLIVSMFAVLKRLFHCNHVDIVTSSEVLAIRDSEHMKKFFEIFGLTSDHNIRNKIQGKGPRECYKSDIVYGDAHNFMVDILCHEYQLSDTRGTRKFDCIIVDEVDSMLIDSSGSKTLLSSSIPGMQDLTKILELIWTEIQKQKGHVNQDQKMVVIGKDGDYLIDFKEHVKNTIKLLLEKQVLNSMIPQQRLDFINFMLEKWIQSAIYAEFYYKENRNYIIEENDKHIKDIKIVDYDNTGVIQQNMKWKDGLHQFLQIKHNLRVSSLSLTTNYLSNVGFFRRYKQNLFGLTGTLGSESTQQLLKAEYAVDLIYIPPYKKRQLTELQGCVAKTEDDWINNICLRIIGEVNMDRALLVINQAISDVTKIDQKLKTLGIKNAKLYIKNGEENNKFIQQQLMPRDIIIATNLAGRGTDIETSEKLEQNGGLHVIVTFMPKNLRVQEQAFGRTGRQGKKGTAQLVLDLNKSLLGNYNLAEVQFEMESLPKKQIQFNMPTAVRSNSQVNAAGNSQINLMLREKQMDFQQDGNQIENRLLQQQGLEGLPKLIVEQPPSLVDICKFVRDKNEEESNNQGKQQMNVMIKDDVQFEQFCETIKSIPNIREQPAIFNAVEEQWGLYLEQNQQNPEKLQSFFTELGQQAKAGSLIQNPKYLVQQALESKIIKIEPLQKALKLNSKDFAPNYYAGMAEIKAGGQEKINSGKAKLIEAKKLILEKVENLKGFHIANEINKSTTQTQAQNQFIQDYQQEQDFQGLQQKELLQNSKIIQSESKLENFKTSNLQLENQLKIYDALISNIQGVIEVVESLNPSSEKLVVEFQNTKSVITQAELQSELDEIITDGPVAKIGKVKKIKKKRGLFSKALMFVVGACQVIAGAAICLFSGGAATSIGVSLIIEGGKDMFKAIKAAWNGLEIDWGAWGQSKVISLGLTLALAGPTALSELGTGFSKLKEVPFLDILKQIPSTTVDGVLKGTQWVGAQLKGVLGNVAKAFKNLELTNLFGNYSEVQANLSNQVTGFIQSGQIPENIGGQIKQIAGEALKNAKSQGGAFISNDLFVQNLKQLSGPFMGYLVQKSAANRTEQENKECLNQVVKENQVQLEKQKPKIEGFIAQQTKLIEKLNSINNQIPQSFQKDQDIQELVRFAQVFLDQNYETEQEQMDTITIDYFPQQFKQSIKKQETKFKKAVEQLNLDDKQQLHSFYTNTIKQIILDSLDELKQQLNNQDFVPLVQPTLTRYCELRKQLQVDLQQEQEQIQSSSTSINSEKASLQQLFKTLEQNVNRTQAQINDYNRRQDSFSSQVDQFNQRTEQCQKRINQFNSQGQTNPNDLIKPLKRVIRKLIEAKLLEQDGVTPKQNITIQQIQTKFQSLLQAELQQDQQSLVNLLLEGFKYAQSQLQQKQRSDFLFNRLSDAIDDQIVNFIVQKIFTDKLQREADNIMQNIVDGK